MEFNQVNQLVGQQINVVDAEELVLQLSSRLTKITFELFKEAGQIISANTPTYDLSAVGEALTKAGVRSESGSDIERCLNYLIIGFFEGRYEREQP